jgi:light-regulated signal transduction histidine kinase (bacteriophytochrome)
VLYFARAITRRLNVVLDNTVLLEQGRPLLAKQNGTDEIGVLDAQFHRMAAALRARTRELEDANAELESFSYSVSHDLRAPLRAIDGYAQMLAEDYEEKFDADGARFLGVIRSEASRLGNLIDDLLAFSRLGRKDLILGDLDVEALARDVFASVSHTAQLDTRHPIPHGMADAAMLRQALTNLFSNAIKFSRKNPEIVVEFGARPGTPLNTYWVRDYGVGFDPKYMNKLFGVFQRLHAEDQFEGTGVGLAIVRRVIRRHGGDVWAESRPDEGATFYFTLTAVREETS